MSAEEKMKTQDDIRKEETRTVYYATVVKEGNN